MRGENLASKEEWNLLAETARRNWLDHGDDFDANYYHLAQAYRGRLTEDLFKIKQSGPDGIIFFPADDIIIDPRCAYILFAMGNYAGAQYFAARSLFSREGVDFAMLKMLARLELIRGNEKIADKYIRMLIKERQCSIASVSVFAQRIFFLFSRLLTNILAQLP